MAEDTWHFEKGVVMFFLANVGPDLAESFGSGQGISLWQTIGGLLAVFGLLMVSLKFLGKFQRQTGPRERGYKVLSGF